eukprot:TRINITY_DN14544_c0_g3_i2.p1 TRINITY_DN14544_c0_g3~~TRINITY_DN14544_c0_g3_i2.p1  ORF type:complete len:323 (+),score=55.13 TRINITY_DN14544_c0_g3_i2:327-1295(+)
MRVKKLKRTRRNIKYYGVNYNFHEPYKVLVDGNFIYSMQKLKLGDVGEAIKNLLGTKRCRTFVPYCVLSELKKMRTKTISQLKSSKKKIKNRKDETNTKKRKRENEDADDSSGGDDDEEDDDNIGDKNTKDEKDTNVPSEQDPENLKQDIKVYKMCMDEVKKLPKHKCGHEEKNICPTECIPQQLGSDNPSLWWIATQDETLQIKVQQMKGVPLITCAINGIRLQPPSESCKTQVDEQLSKDMEVAEWEKNTDALRGHLRSRGRSKGWRRNKAKGPNPLSVKKKRVKTVDQDIQRDQEPKKKRPRRKKQVQDENHGKGEIIT